MFKRFIARFRRQRSQIDVDWLNSAQSALASPIMKLFPGERIPMPVFEGTEVTIRHNGVIIWRQALGPRSASVEASVGDPAHAAIVGPALAGAAHQSHCNFGDLLGDKIALWSALAPISA